MCKEAEKYILLEKGQLNIRDVSCTINCIAGYLLILRAAQSSLQGQSVHHHSLQETTQSCGDCCRVQTVRNIRLVLQK
jgi:glyceraldehyde-3-phosphate dehydrogenase/erythrose-4-phosphate dehydrogenase